MLAFDCISSWKISFNMHHFFLKDFSTRNSSTNKGKSLLFYCQQMCKHFLNCFLFQSSPAPFWNLSSLRGKVLLNVREATQMVVARTFQGLWVPPNIESWLFCGQQHIRPCLQLAQSPGSHEHIPSHSASSSDVISWAKQEGKEGRDAQPENLQVRPTLNWSRMKPFFPPKLQVSEMLTGVFGVGN